MKAAITRNKRMATKNTLLLSVLHIAFLRDTFTEVVALRLLNPGFAASGLDRMGS
jgi:hypothetical protein